MEDVQDSITTSDRKPSKQIMLRLPEVTVERIDEYAGRTHSSRPDFITDAVRQYIHHVLYESAEVVEKMDSTGHSQEAMAVFFGEYMGECVFREFEDYRNSRKNRVSTRDVSVLISIPWGLDDLIARTIAATGLFKNNQELIKVSIEYMLRFMEEDEERLDFLGNFHSESDTRRALDEELRQLRKEIGPGREERRDERRGALLGVRAAVV